MTAIPAPIEPFTSIITACTSTGNTTSVTIRFFDARGLLSLYRNAAQSPSTVEVSVQKSALCAVSPVVVSIILENIFYSHLCLFLSGSNSHFIFLSYFVGKYIAVF